jgi:hypothetical protein
MPEWVVCLQEAEILGEIGKPVKENLGMPARPGTRINARRIGGYPPVKSPAGFPLRVFEPSGMQFACYSASKKKVLSFLLGMTIKTFVQDLFVHGRSAG